MQGKHFMLIAYLITYFGLLMVCWGLKETPNALPLLSSCHRSLACKPTHKKIPLPLTGAFLAEQFFCVLRLIRFATARRCLKCRTSLHFKFCLGARHRYPYGEYEATEGHMVSPFINNKTLRS